ncbi:MAG: hypothetical protein KBF55_04950 [Polaromonas sp.]|jgi:hypothetical protein|nr:hypothetical protein [Polaromonas sp.]MBP9057683.1 hypothetical protein [Polaromonas sp.]
MKTIQKSLLFIATFCYANFMYAQDSAVYNASRGTWSLYYQDAETKQWVNKEYVQQNAIAPQVQSSVRWTGKAFQYNYTVRNQRLAKQAIDLFRVWGIPLIYSVPNMPPITADFKADSENWWQQRWAQSSAKREFENNTVKAPKGWSAGLRTDEEANQTSFVFTPGLKDSDPSGINPGDTLRGFRVDRTELPGVTTAKMTGATDEPWGLDALPETPYWEQKVDEIQDLDYLTVPVLAPIIVVPSPYNGAELAKRIKTHMASWLKLGLITQDTLDRLNRSFDSLIAAQTYNNIAGTREAVREILQEAYSHHRGLDHNKNEEDDDEHDAVPINSKAPATVPINRVAARTLSFDLMYLLTRAYVGK